MHILLLSVGTRLPEWVDRACEHYARRMPPHCRFQLKEIPAGKRTKGSDIEETALNTNLEAAREVARQLRGEAGERQLQNVKRGLAQNMGGSGGSAVVSILEVL